MPEDRFRWRGLTLRVVAGAALLAAWWWQHSHWWAVVLFLSGAPTVLRALGLAATRLAAYLERLLEPDLETLRALRPIGFAEGEGSWAVRLDHRGGPAVVLVVGRSFGVEALPALRMVAGDLPATLVTGITEPHAKELVKRLRRADARATALNQASRRLAAGRSAGAAGLA